MKDTNLVRSWPLEPFPAGASLWPKMVGRLTGHGESHYQFFPDYFCPHIVLRGSGTVSAAGGEWLVGPGDMFTLWPGVKIEYFEEPSAPWEYLWIHLIGSGTPEFVEACGFLKEKPFLKAAVPDDVSRRLEFIHEAFGRRNPVEACAVLSSLYGMPPSCSPPPAPTAGNPRRELVERVVATLETLLHTSLSVNELSTMFNVSRVTLFRAFEEVLGVSPMEYLDRKRMQKASMLLSETDHPVAFVAKACGYNNPKYFMRRFKSANNATPTAFRLARQ